MIVEECLYQHGDARAGNPGTTSSSGCSGRPCKSNVPRCAHKMLTVVGSFKVRGALCEGLGRVDEAVAAYDWVIEAGKRCDRAVAKCLKLCCVVFPAGEAGRLKGRDLHVYAYALYEKVLVTPFPSQRSHGVNLLRLFRAFYSPMRTKPLIGRAPQP
jgi:hypothetical protein